MKDEQVNALLENEREWRRHILIEVSDIKKELSGLKMKVAGIATIIGLVTSYIQNKFLG